MTRVLYIVDEAYPTTSANGRIVYRIIDELVKYPDIQITILSRARKKEQLTIEEYNGCPIIHSPSLYSSKAEKLSLKLGKFKWLRYILFPRTIYYRCSNESDYFMAEAKLWIKRHIKDFDIIVANSMPFYPLNLAAQFGNELPVIFYKMEPVAHLNREDFEKMKAKEELWDNNAAAIIMEDLVYKYYKKYASKENIQKVIVTKFPCVIRRNSVKSEKLLKDDVLNLVYVGKFYNKVRNPQYMFSLIEKLKDQGVHLTFAGGYYYSGLPKDIIEKYFTNKLPYITYLGELPADKADALLDEADVLVHLGNKIPDEMPSKILDYISSGKPILNIYGIDDCPTLPYLSNYPYAMNIKVGTELTDGVIESLLSFIRLSKGKEVPFRKIREQYEECTPQYVGRQFYEIINQVVQTSSNS